MANYVVGTIRFRGLKSNILKLFKNTYKTLKSEIDNESYPPRLIEKLNMNEQYLSKFIKDDLYLSPYDENYIKSVNPYYTQIDIPDFKDGSINILNAYLKEDLHNSEDVIFIAGFIQRWGYDSHQLINIAKKYHLDIKCIGYDKGTEKRFEYEVTRFGKILSTEEKSIDNYFWIAENPIIGG